MSGYVLKKHDYRSEKLKKKNHYKSHYRKKHSVKCLTLFHLFFYCLHFVTMSLFVYSFHPLSTFIGNTFKLLVPLFISPKKQTQRFFRGWNKTKPYIKIISFWLQVSDFDWFLNRAKPSNNFHEEIFICTSFDLFSLCN